MLEKYNNHLLRKQTTLPLKIIHLLPCFRTFQIIIIQCFPFWSQQNYNFVVKTDQTVLAILRLHLISALSLNILDAQAQKYDTSKNITILKDYIIQNKYTCTHSNMVHDTSQMRHKFNSSICTLTTFLSR